MPLKSAFSDSSRPACGGAGYPRYQQWSQSPAARSFEATSQRQSVAGSGDRFSKLCWLAGTLRVRGVALGPPVVAGRIAQSLECSSKAGRARPMRPPMSSRACSTHPPSPSVAIPSSTPAASSTWRCTPTTGAQTRCPSLPNEAWSDPRAECDDGPFVLAAAS